jgi:hypothetical protein
MELIGSTHLGLGRSVPHATRRGVSAAPGWLAGIAVSDDARSARRPIHRETAAIPAAPRCSAAGQHATGNSPKTVAATAGRPERTPDASEADGPTGSVCSPAHKPLIHGKPSVGVARQFTSDSTAGVGPHELRRPPGGEVGPRFRRDARAPGQLLTRAPGDGDGDVLRRGPSRAKASKGVLASSSPFAPALPLGASSSSCRTAALRLCTPPGVAASRDRGGGHAGRANTRSFLNRRTRGRPLRDGRRPGREDMPPPNKKLSISKAGKSGLASPAAGTPSASTLATCLWDKDTVD